MFPVFRAIVNFKYITVHNKPLTIMGNLLEAEQDSINNRRCIVHHIALIQNFQTYNTEAIIVEKTPRVNIKC